MDGTLGFDKALSGVNTNLVDVSVTYDALISDGHTVTIHTGDIVTASATGPYLGGIGFFNSQTGGYAFWAASNASEGALSSNGANEFTFNTSGSGPYALRTSNYSDSYDIVSFDFFFEAAGDRLAIDAVKSNEATPMPMLSQWWQYALFALVLVVIAVAHLLRAKPSNLLRMLSLFSLAMGLGNGAYAQTTLSIDDVFSTESDAALSGIVFTVTRSDDLGPVSVQYDSADETATAGSDYTAVSGGTLNFSPGGPLSLPIVVPVFDDAIHERPETLVVTLSSPTGATLADDTGSATLGNDDNAQVTLSNILVEEGDGPGATGFVFTLTLQLAVDHSVEFFYFTSDGTATTADNDYVSESNSVTFVGDAMEVQTISIPVNGDRNEEDSETFSLLFGTTPNDGGRGVSINPAFAQATIIDDDVDSDRDGLSDAREAILGTEANDADSDNDDLRDGLEVALGTDPLDSNDPADSMDSDGDGIPDSLDTDPFDPDSDDDGIVDGYELAVNGNLDDPIYLGDADGDGVTTSDDVQLILQVAVNGASVPPGARESDLDLDQDGDVDRTDALLLLYFMRALHRSGIPFDY